jgi:uncharacterized protein
MRSPEACATILRDCWGECLKNRLILTPDGEPGLNYLCAGMKRYYHHVLPTIEQIADEIRRQHGKASPASR